MNLKILILNILKVAHRNDRMSSKDLIKSECQVKLCSRIGDAEFDTAIGELIDGHFVDSIEQKFTGDRLYFITDLGRAQL